MVLLNESYAASIVADAKHKKEVQGLAKRQERRKDQPRWVDADQNVRYGFTMNEMRNRRALLERVRAGRPGAAEELWARYRCRLIEPPNGKRNGDGESREGILS